jgi:hypothetical protein
LVVQTLSPLQIVGVIFAMIAGAALVVQPLTGLMALIALRIAIDLLWFLDFSLLGLRLTELYAGVGAVGVLVLLLPQVERVGRHAALPWVLPLLVLLGLAAVRVGGSGAPLLVRLGSPPLVLIAASLYLRNPDTAWRYLAVFAVAGLVPLTRSAYSIATGQDYELLAGAYRLIAGYQNATNHALIMALFAQVGVLGLVAARTRPMQVAAAVYTGVALLAVRESYNRSNVVAMAVFLAVFLVLERRWRLLGLAVPVLIATIGLNDVMQERFAEILSFSSSPSYDASAGDAGSGRWGLWTSSFRVWSSGPAYELLLGRGLGQHFIGDGGIDPHNDYLAITYQAGPLAAGAFLAVLARGAWLGVVGGRAAKDERTRLLAHFGAASTIAAMLTCGITNGYIVRSSAAWYLFAITGIAYAMGSLAIEARPPAPELRRPPPRPAPVDPMDAPPAPRADQRSSTPSSP